MSFFGGKGGLFGGGSTYNNQDTTQMSQDELLQYMLDHPELFDNTGNGDTTGIGDSAGPAFEDLFQEELQKLLGPDPGATFRNVFKDIFEGVANTPFETFVQSQFQNLQDSFITFARKQSEQGLQSPTFEQFLAYTKPDLQKRFNFTQEGAGQSLQQLLDYTGNIDTPFSQFVVSNFDRIFNSFTEAGNNAERAGGQPQDFLKYLEGQQSNLHQQFEYTKPGAAESFRNTQNLTQGSAETPFERYIGSNFDKIFQDFQLAGTDRANGPKSFGGYLGANKDKLMNEFMLIDPRFSGRGSMNDLVGLTRTQG